MNRDEEKKVITYICKFSTYTDYSDSQAVDRMLGKVMDDPLFGRTVYGERFINRLLSIQSGKKLSECFFCSKEAQNGMVCDACMKLVIPTYGDKKTAEKEIKKQVKKQAEEKPDQTYFENLFKDMDDSLTRLASQNSINTLKRLEWLILGISVINTIVIIFICIFFWRYLRIMM